MTSHLFQKIGNPKALTIGLLCLTLGLAVLFLNWFGDDGNRSPTASPTTTEVRAIQVHDTDGDGKLSKSERQEMEAKFVSAFDEDGDGELSQSERQAVRSAAQVNVQPSVAKPGTLNEAAAFLARMDQDSDGQVTAPEAGEKRWAMLAEADKNADGQVSAQEWLDHRGATED